MALRLGEMLVKKGILRPEQVEEILQAQRGNARPFGELAEDLFGVSASDIQDAWAGQLCDLATRIDPACEHLDESVRNVISRRQAWQFKILPLRRDSMGLILVTCPEYLPRAARFAAWHFGEPITFAITEPKLLEEALDDYYPLPGMHFAM